MKTILIDCDGVLYPLSELSTAEIVDAAKQTYREDLKLTGAEQQMISEQSIAEGHLGLFNYLKAICEHKNYDFNRFCINMAGRIDYSRIQPNKSLWFKLQSLTSQYNVAIASNNSRAHIGKVTEQLFGKSADEVEKSGIKIFDITDMRDREGWFMPKRVPNALKFLAAKNNYSLPETILFDDTSNNIKTARQIGMYATLITPKNTLENNLQAFIHRPINRGRAYE